ncbi:ABC transporter substrate-binding protein [Castellaniella sp. MT123]|uniref:ABC transporter substrate-binding protein n=1 Tax=Castellaniella sp. MT123 TaxID=3140381 RepID=UPI0031F3A6FB
MRHPVTRTVLCAAILSGALAATAGAQTAPQGYPAGYQPLVSAAAKEGKVIVYSTTDTKAANPVIQDFEKLYPGIKVEYNDMNSTELYSRYLSEQASGSNSGDVVWSSAMDATMKLAKSYAMAYPSVELSHLPAWSVWEKKAYGTTFEPAVFIYNKRLVKADEVPTTHAAFAKLVAGDTARFKSKVTTYDVEKSAVGFMLAVQDQRNDPNYQSFLKDSSKAGLVVQSSTGTMMERVSSGENLLGYNILGSYAETRAKSDPSLGVSYPTDYTLILSRVAFISKGAQHPNAAKLWMDYLLSQRGQNVLANQANLASVRTDIDGDNDVDGMTKKLGSALKPIPVDESLLDYLDQGKRLAFIKMWRKDAGK